MNRVLLFQPRGPRPLTTPEDWRTEYEACKHWDRPPRKYHTDTPFYPWAPKPHPYKISFKLGFSQ